MTPRRLFTSLAIAVLTLAGLPAVAQAQANWTWPLEHAPPALQGFDPPAEPWQSGHRGVDLAGMDGEPVHAAGAGVVTYAGLVAGVGIVTVTHSELRTTYQPVEPAVTGGERVAAGQLLGTLTTEGSHCAPSACLHWGLLRGNTYLDPLSLVQSAGQPRLVPLGRSALDAHRPPALPGDAQVPAEPSAGYATPSVSEQAAMGMLAGIDGGSIP